MDLGGWLRSLGLGNMRPHSARTVGHRLKLAPPRVMKVKTLDVGKR